MEGTIGEIRMFAGNFAPKNWSLCQGQLVNITSNTALFSILGTTYGGNGTTTFALPDLRGRVAIGVGAGPGLTPINLGDSGGANNTTLQLTNLPAHTHTANTVPPTATLKAATTNASISTPTVASSLATPGSLSGRTFTASLGYDTAAPSVALNVGSVTLNGGGVQIGITGSNVPFSIMPPYLGMNYIICIAGLFPPRN